MPFQEINYFKVLISWMSSFILIFGPKLIKFSTTVKPDIGSGSMSTVYPAMKGPTV